MSTTNAPTTTASPLNPSATKARTREKRSHRGAEAAERLKTVVRRLPPNLPEDIFWQSVQPWVTEETVTWKAFFPGKVRKSANKENVSSRAYIAFKDSDQLAAFSKGYDGHVFRDKAGNESQAVVEYAPYSKIPAERKKADARQGTIEKNEDYLSFLALLTAEPTKSSDTDTLELLVASTQRPPSPKITPLLQSLIAQKAEKAERAAQKEREREKANMPTPTLLSAKRDGKKGHVPSASSSTPAKAAAVGAKGSSQAKAPPASAKSGGVQLGPAAKGGAPPPKAGDVASKRGSRKGKQPAIADPTILSAPPAASASTPSATPTSPARNSHPRRERPPRPAASAAAAPAQSTTSTDTAATEGGSSPAAPPARRRPAVGLASRQFEAALSGAGVSSRRRGGGGGGGPGPAGPAAGTNAESAGSGGSGPEGAVKLPSARIDDPGSELPPTPISASISASTPGAGDGVGRGGGGGEGGRGGRRGGGRRGRGAPRGV